jgi:hypothetical protein
MLLGEAMEKVVDKLISTAAAMEKIRVVKFISAKMNTRPPIQASSLSAGSSTDVRRPDDRCQGLLELSHQMAAIHRAADQELQ